MSRKLFASRKWKRRISEAQKRELRKVQRKRTGPYGGTRPKRSPRRRVPFIVLTPPETLSFIRNPVETIHFLKELEDAIPRARIHIEFGSVLTITPEAPLALLATIRKFSERAVGGSVPNHADARSVLELSGFFAHVRHGFTIRAEVEGAISQYTGDSVDANLARNLVRRGTELLFGEARDSEPSYGILIEGMENTIAHAHEDYRKPKESTSSVEAWWASVYVDKARGRICFSIVDAGVGVLKSARVTLLRKIDQIFRSRADAELLTDIFNGLMQSRTGLDNRGKGLPAIKKLSDSGSINSLIFVTNSVHADFESKTFKTLPESYSGTLMYWEIEG